MSSKVVVMKLGHTMTSLQREKGDFEDWIMAPLEKWRDWLETFNVLTARELPDYDRIAGIILSGSHSMVTDRTEWSERLACWLSGLVQRNIPVLGICYGHQLLAHALGGEVADNPLGIEFGTVTITFTEEAKRDPLLGSFFPAIQAHVAHTQSVIRLPLNARRLAFSERDGNQAFVIGNSAWGVQFHPEFDHSIVKCYIEQNSARLQSQGDDPLFLSAKCVESTCGVEVLRKFMSLVMERQPDLRSGQKGCISGYSKNRMDDHGL